MKKRKEIKKKKREKMTKSGMYIMGCPAPSPQKVVACASVRPNGGERCAAERSGVDLGHFTAILNLGKQAQSRPLVFTSTAVRGFKKPYFTGGGCAE
jgi:hypothetical protein